MNKIDYIKSLVDKYFDARLSLKEEALLRQYFARDKNVPESLKMYQPIFSYFSVERKNVLKHGRKIYIRWISLGVAASLFLFIGLRIAYVNFHGAVRSSVYVDGKRYNNMNVIGAKTLEALDNFMNNDNEKDVISSQINMLDSFNE